MAGECRVVFPQKERVAAGASSGETVAVYLELDAGYREVDMPEELLGALSLARLEDAFAELSYSKRKEFARSVREAKATDTKSRRVQAVIESLSSSGA